MPENMAGNGTFFHLIQKLKIRIQNINFSTKLNQNISMLQRKHKNYSDLNGVMHFSLEAFLIPLGSEQAV